MVKRYDFDYDGGDTLGVHERSDGHYVAASDYDALAARLAEVERELLAESRERIAEIRRHERTMAELVHLEQAYSNRHSPQHRAAALNSAQGHIAANTERAADSADAPPHTRIEDCPTYYDGCNCEAETATAASADLATELQAKGFQPKPVGSR